MSLLYYFRKFVLAAVLIVVGLVAFISSFSNRKREDDGIHTSYQTYGGDAYTGMQRASADAARNVETLIKVVSNGVADILLVAGLAMIGMGVVVLIPEEKKVVSPVKPFRGIDDNGEN